MKKEIRKFRIFQKSHLFSKLSKRVFGSLVLPCLLLIFLVSAVSQTMMSNTLYRSYRTMAKQFNDNFSNEIELYLDSVSATVYNLSKNSRITTELMEQNGASLTSVLDDYCNYSLAIDAITVYSPDGAVYTSSKITAEPSLNVLSKNMTLESFFADDAMKSGLFLRNSDIARIYNDTAYPAENGVISCVQKIYDAENALIGVAFADILPSSLYARVDQDKSENLKNAYFFIASNQSFLHYNGNQTAAHFLSQCEQEQTDDYRYLLFSSDCSESITAVTVVPLNGFKRQLWILISTFSVSSAALLVCVLLIGKRTALDLTYRLDKLAARMEQEAR